MEKFSKLKSFFKKEKKQNPVKDFVHHCDAKVFCQNPYFHNLASRITAFSPKGQFKVHQNGQEVFAKTGEMLLGEDEKLELTAFVFPHDEGLQAASRYIELRHGGSPVGIGNVWHRSGKAKTIFLYENKNATGFAQDVVSVIKIAENGKIGAYFYDMAGAWLGASEIVLDEKTGKNVYDFYITPMLLGFEKKDCFMCAEKCVGKENVCHPITFAQNLYKQTPQIFDTMAFATLLQKHRQKETENEK